jgi:putative transposase
MQSEAERSCYYSSLRLDISQIARVESIRIASPSRKVGRGGRLNTTVLLRSKLNNELRALESYSCEFLFALELEVLSQASAYFCQPGIQGIERVIDSRRYVNSATLDVMVFQPDGIHLVECKPLNTIEQKLNKEHPKEWVKLSDRWTNLPYQTWSEQHGFIFRVWSPPEPCAIYLSNLMLLYSLKGAAISASENRLGQRLLRMLSKGPISIAQACEDIRGLTPRIVGILLGVQALFCTLKSTPLDNLDACKLFLDRARCDEVDDALLASLRAKLVQPTVNNPALCATTTDYDRGVERLERALSMIRGDQVVTRRYKNLVNAVRQSQIDGTSPVLPCLTKYASSGRRDAQLTPLQRACMEYVFNTFWDSGAVRFKKDLYFKLLADCEDKGETPPSQTTMRTYLKNRSRTKHILNTEGRKAYHADENSTDIVTATMPALCPGLMVHIDSSKLDARISTQVAGALPFDCPTLYVAIDSCTDEPVGRTLAFGASCRDFLAILLRDILHRHGALPRYIMMDGGSENLSNWMKDFCNVVGISVLKPPTGDPKKNSKVENAIGRVNLHLSQRLLGSTQPDKQGRKVDNRFKSYTNAVHVFKSILDELETYLFEDFVETPTANSIGSPKEKREALGSSYGEVGIRIPFDDSFKILTSIPVTNDISALGIRGYRHAQQLYRSNRLSECLRHGKAEQKRRDCVDPTLMYFKFGTEWVSGSSSGSITARSLSDADLLFFMMSGKKIRATNENIRSRIARRRMTRIDQANASAAATAHLKPRDEVVIPNARVELNDELETLTNFEPYSTVGI